MDFLQKYYVLASGIVFLIATILSYSSDRQKEDGKPTNLTYFLLVAGIAFTAIGVYGLF